MNEFSGDNISRERDHEVGEVLLIGTEEWTIGEIIDGKYILYHEGISGTSHTMELTREELNSRIVEIE